MAKVIKAKKDNPAQKTEQEEVKSELGMVKPVYFLLSEEAMTVIIRTLGKIAWETSDPLIQYIKQNAKQVNLSEPIKSNKNEQIDNEASN